MTSRVHRRPLSWPGYLYECLVYYGFLLLFGAMCLSWSVVAIPLGLLLPRRLGTQVGRRMISFGFRCYLSLLELSGIIKCDLAELDRLGAERSLIVAPNHPSLIDVVLVASRLPDVACIVKADLWDRLAFRGSAKLAGYIRNTSGSGVVRDAVTELRAGSHLLIFPEGTRTVGNVLEPFKGGFALISKRARAPVQTVLIDISHPFLCKGRSLFEKPEFPLVIRARLGRRFRPPEAIRQYISDMEGYYRHTINYRPEEP